MSPEGVHLAPPLKEGEGLLIADLDMSLVTKRKRMMDSVGHYARPELLSLNLDDRPTAPVHAMSRVGGHAGLSIDGAAHAMPPQSLTPSQPVQQMATPAATPISRVA